MYQTVGSLGMDIYSRREIAYVHSNNGDIEKTFSELFFSRLLLLVLTILAYIPFIYKNTYSLFYMIHLLTIVGFFVDSSWFFIGLEDMKSVVIRNTLVKLLSTFLIFLLIKSSDDLTLYIMIYSVSQFVSCICMFPRLKRYIKRIHVKNLNIKKHIKPVLILFLPQAASGLYTQFDRIMIGNLVTNISEVTIYEKAEALILLPLKFVAALSVVVLPRTAGLFAADDVEGIREILRKITNVTIALVLPMCVGLALVSDILLPVYLGEEYFGSILVLKILAFSTIAISLSNITGIQYLMATNKTKVLTLSYSIAAVTNIFVNYFMIKYGAAGAALATVLAEWIVFTVQYVYMLRNGIGLRITDGMWKRVIAVIIMTLAIAAVRFIMGTTLLSAITQIFVGTIMYFTVLFVCRDNLFYLIK